MDLIIISQRLSVEPPLHLPPVDACLDVHTCREPGKDRISLGHLVGFASSVSGLL